MITKREIIIIRPELLFSKKLEQSNIFRQLHFIHSTVGYWHFNHWSFTLRKFSRPLLFLIFYAKWTYKNDCKRDILLPIVGYAIFSIIQFHSKRIIIWLFIVQRGRLYCFVFLLDFYSWSSFSFFYKPQILIKITSLLQPYFVHFVHRGWSFTYYFFLFIVFA